MYVQYLQAASALMHASYYTVIENKCIWNSMHIFLEGMVI